MNELKLFIKTQLKSALNASTRDLMKFFLSSTSLNEHRVVKNIL